MQSASRLCAVKPEVTNAEIVYVDVAEEGIFAAYPLEMSRGVIGMYKVCPLYIIGRLEGL